MINTGDLYLNKGHAMSCNSSIKPTMGIIGFGAFGQLMAKYLAPYFDIVAYDPAPIQGTCCSMSLAKAAQCSVVVLAVPVAVMRETVCAILPHISAGTLVLDVGSVKMQTAAVMRELIPPYIDVVAAHPLFGPQSARGGLAGLKIALCPVHGNRHKGVAQFLQTKLGLDVIITTPRDHDRDLALVQGLTHLIAKVLTRMEPLPSRMTTRSFDLIVEAIDMVRDDAPEVFHAIEVANPFAKEVRDQFFDVARQVDKELCAQGNAEVTLQTPD